MFPRYGRKNRRYRVRPVKDTKRNEKKLLVQSAVSFIIALIWIIVSFFEFAPKKKLNRYLYSTYSFKEWQEAFLPAVKKIKSTSSDVAGFYMSFFNIEDEKAKKISPTPSAEAKIEVTDKLEKEEKTSKEDSLLWRMPLGGEISSEFGERVHPLSGEVAMHTGIDIASDEGEGVYAVCEGVVKTTGYDSANGNYVILTHQNGITSVYIHLSKITVSEGDRVTIETKIGEVGSTGNATGPHLHFEIKENGESVDPSKYIK